MPIRRLLILLLINRKCFCEAFPDGSLQMFALPDFFSPLDWLFCSKISTRFCTSSVYLAKKWIRENCHNETAQDADDELLAMIDFFFSTNSAAEGPLKELRWLESGCNPCTFYGIFCDYTNSIEAIDLASLGLEGTIPTTIGLLTNMEFLSLDTNSLTGHVPSEIGALTSLNSLKIEKNDLTGTLPVEICVLKGWEGVFTYIAGDCGGATPDLVCAFPECCSECYFS